MLVFLSLFNTKAHNRNTCKTTHLELHGTNQAAHWQKSFSKLRYNLVFTMYIYVVTVCVGVIVHKAYQKV